MSGECNECGVTGCVERNHCAFRDEIARLTAEVERLRNERDMAQITVAMKQGVILDLTEKVDALRARCGRLRELALASVRPSIDIASPESVRWLKAHTRCYGHNDLSEQEQTDA